MATKRTEQELQSIVHLLYIYIDSCYKQNYVHNAVLSVHGDCLLYYERVIIPSKLRTKILDILHVGISKMKNIARRFVY